MISVSLLLGGEAARWFEPKIRDFIENKPKRRDTNTSEIFSSLDNFFNYVRTVFGERDEQVAAELKIQALK